MLNIPITLKNLREYRGLSLEQMSEASNIAIEHLKDYEQYKKIPTCYEVTIILNVLKLDCDEIFMAIFRDIINKI